MDPGLGAVGGGGLVVVEVRPHADGGEEELGGVLAVNQPLPAAATRGQHVGQEQVVTGGAVKAESVTLSKTAADC